MILLRAISNEGRPSDWGDFVCLLDLLMRLAKMRCMHNHQGKNDQTWESCTATGENLVELVEGCSAENGLGSIWSASQLATDNFKEHLSQSYFLSVVMALDKCGLRWSRSGKCPLWRDARLLVGNEINLTISSWLKLNVNMNWLEVKACWYKMHILI